MLPIVEPGPNPWHHLPRPEVTARLQGIADGGTRALLAQGEGGLLGFVSHVRTTHEHPPLS